MRRRRRNLFGESLPEGWRDGLSPRQVERVLATEEAADRGEFPITPSVGRKGYREVYLGRWHPYARGNGLQKLHRYVAMRVLGRVLETWEHVHHRADAPLDSTDPTDLRICEEIDHAHYHYEERIRCGREVETWEPRREDGRFTPYPSDAEVERRIREELGFPLMGETS